MTSNNDIPLFDIFIDINKYLGREKYSTSSVTIKLFIECIMQIMHEKNFSFGASIPNILQQAEDDLMVCIRGVFGWCTPEQCHDCQFMKSKISEESWKIWLTQPIALINPDIESKLYKPFEKQTASITNLQHPQTTQTQLLRQPQFVVVSSPNSIYPMQNPFNQNSIPIYQNPHFNYSNVQPIQPVQSVQSLQPVRSFQQKQSVQQIPIIPNPTNPIKSKINSVLPNSDRIDNLNTEKKLTNQTFNQKPICRNRNDCKNTNCQFLHPSQIDCKFKICNNTGCEYFHEK